MAFLDLLAAHEAPSVADGSAVELYRTWVLEEPGADLLEQWQPVRTLYDEFAGGASWGAPLGLRRSMARWEFSDATRVMSELADLPAGAAQVQELADHLAVDLPTRVQENYELADSDEDYTAVRASLANAHSTLARYEEAAAVAYAERGLIDRIGAIPLRLEATAQVAAENISLDEFAASRAASDLVIERAAWVTRVGVAIVVGAALALLLVIGGLVALVRRSRRRPGSQARDWSEPPPLY